MDWASIVTSGVTSLFVSGAAWKFVQSYIAKAVDHRLQKEIERYKSQLTLELERERQLAAQDLERFKSELALPAELRRQLASKKLEALLALVAEGEPFMREVFNAPPRDPLVLDRMIKKLHATSIYMDKSTYKQLWQYITEIHMAKGEYDRATDPNAQLAGQTSVNKMGVATDRAQRAYEAVMDLLRKELGTALAPPSHALTIRTTDTPGDASTPPHL